MWQGERWEGGEEFPGHPLSVRTNGLGMAVLCYNACGCPVTYNKEYRARSVRLQKAPRKGPTPPHLPSTLHVLLHLFPPHCCLSLLPMGKHGKHAAKNNTKKGPPSSTLGSTMCKSRPSPTSTLTLPKNKKRQKSEKLKEKKRKEKKEEKKRRSPIGRHMGWHHRTREAGSHGNPFRDISPGSMV